MSMDEIGGVRVVAASTSQRVKRVKRVIRSFCCCAQGLDMANVSNPLRGKQLMK